jgi:hypothetical protein
MFTATYSEVKWSTSDPGRFTPKTEPRHLSIKRLDAPQNRSGRSGKGKKILAPARIGIPDNSVTTPTTVSALRF